MFKVLNLFLAMLLNAFASDVLRKNSSEEGGSALGGILRKMKAVFCGCCTRNRTGSVGPSGGKREETAGAVDADGKHFTVALTNYYFLYFGGAL